MVTIVDGRFVWKHPEQISMCCIKYNNNEKKNTRNNDSKSGRCNFNLLLDVCPKSFIIPRLTRMNQIVWCSSMKKFRRKLLGNNWICHRSTRQRSRSVVDLAPVRHPRTTTVRSTRATPRARHDLSAAAILTLKRGALKTPAGDPSRGTL